MADSFTTFSGGLNLLSGVLLILYWFAFAILLPYGDLTVSLSILVKNPRWTKVNLVGVIGALFGLLGQAGIYLYQFGEVGWTASIGFYIASAGTALLLGTMLWDTILWPILVKQDESLLAFSGPIYQSKTFLPFFISAGALYAVGYVLVGIGIIQGDILPQIAGILLAVGAPAFALGPMFGRLQVYLRSIGVTLLSLALIILGLAML